LRERKAQRLDTINAASGEDAVKRDSGDLLGSSEVRRKVLVFCRSPAVYRQYPITREYKFLGVTCLIYPREQ
jgi:hypothetical protein